MKAKLIVCGLAAVLCVCVWLVLRQDQTDPDAVEQVQEGPSVSKTSTMTSEYMRFEPSQAEWNEAYDCLWDLHSENRLMASWTAPDMAAGPNPGAVVDFTMESLHRDIEKGVYVGDYEATLSLRSIVYVDPETQMDTVEWEGLWISQEMVEIGRCTVGLRPGADGMEAVSCVYMPYENPGHSYLAQATRRAADLLENSPKIDIDRYDPRLVEYVYRRVQMRRLIDGPEALTEYDLLKYVDTLDITPWNFEELGVAIGEEPLESSLLALLTGVQSVTLQFPLTDYSVFCSMDRIDSFTINEADQDTMDSLRIGYTNMLNIIDPQFDILDTSNIGLSSVMMHSWRTGISEFRNCGNIESLVMQTTKMDTALLHRDNLPGATHLLLDYYHDYNKPHDFSNLASFPSDTEIYMQLNYLACQPETLESLRGVRLDSLTLRPDDGNPTGLALDLSILNDLNCRMIVVERSTT